MARKLIGFDPERLRVAISTGVQHTESHNEQMSYCPPLGLFLLGDRPGLGVRKDSSESGSPARRDLQASPAHRVDQ